uniref:WGS project CBME000000000 data, contig CS3487_c001421 n=2 Tax=Fusarium pseudograminearum TaxID=101028 RepID=A0A096PDC1_FUSPS|nr:unnamed protein product [Fusarium pseudograminearum CS3220]CEG02964.1 unnamed protein product [Fusarium pseudograminearum CS3487]
MIYTPLGSTRHEIRLLTLHPATEESDRICCTLSHAELKPTNYSTFPVYEALSYVWGKPDFSELILLNDTYFNITPSLKYALSCLRYRTQPRVLWVDALCINQSNISERNQQVALMREIYSKCERDIAWLDPVVGVAFTSDDIYNDPKLAQMEASIKEGMELMNTIIEKDRNTLGELLAPYHDGGYRLEYNEEVRLRDLFDLPFLWKRLWVMQELSLAPKLVLICKGAELDWDSLSALLKDQPYLDAFHMGDSHAFYLPVWSDLFVRIKLIEDQRRLFSSPGQVSSKLMDVLTRFREMESTDPRDRIYSLLGLATDDHGIHADYTKSVPDLYRTTTISLINLSGNLDILCQNPFEASRGHKALQHAQDALPSWVAEFNSSHRDCAEIIFAQREIFNAGVKTCETPSRLLEAGSDTLIVRGIILGAIGPILQVRDQDYTARDILKLYFSEEVILKPKSRIYAPKIGGKTLTSGETCLRAFWRTLVKDCTLPPKMRRLRSHEVRSLDKVNMKELSNETMINVSTICVENDLYSDRSMFSKCLGNTLDYSGIKSKFSTSPVGNPYSHYATKHYMFVVTDNGLYVLARPHVEEGDVVAILDGGKVPMILRKTDQVSNSGKDSTGGAYRVVCPAYVHGFMDGKAEAGVTEGWLKKQDILLV